MRVLLINPSFSHYRIPFYAELRSLLSESFTLLYCKDRCKHSVVRKVESVLASDAIGMEGERVLQIGNDKTSFANKGYKFCYQPGLLRAALSVPADVIIAEGFFQWTPAAVIRKLVQKTPLIITYECTAHTERNVQWYRTAYRKFVMRWIDVICCNGRLCGEYVQSLGFPAEHITYGYMAADVNGFKNAAAAVPQAKVHEIIAQHNLKGIVFLYVGRLIPRKGIKELLKGWKLFTSRVTPDQATLLLVGDGLQRGELVQYCKGNGLRNVRFAGETDYDALASYYKIADVFVMPTLEDNWSLNKVARK